MWASEAAPDLRPPEVAPTLPTPEAAAQIWHGLVRLTALVAGLAALCALVPTLLAEDPLVMEVRASGLAGSALAALLLALGGLAGTAVLARARLLAQGDAALGGAPLRVGRAARRPQGTLVPLAAAAALAVLWGLRPLDGPTLPPDAQYLIAGVALALAFPLLLAERTLAATPVAWLPEAPWLAALLFLPLATLALHATLAVLDGLGVAGPDGAWDVLAARLWLLPLTLVGLELLSRGLLQWVLPVPAAAAARAAADSVVARLIHPGGLARAGLAAPLRANFGIDVSRSWALAYLRASALPALALTLLFCWGLTGLVAVNLDGRAVYERLGVPVAVLGPGLHLVLPWPLGRLRRTEYGAVHALPLGPGALHAADRAAADGAAADGAAADGAAADGAAAEAPPPPSADRLWDQTHQNELAVLIASAALAAQDTLSQGTAPQAAGLPNTAPPPAGRQSFQTVSLDARVLWRIGLDDASVLRAVYNTADPQALVRSAAGRLIAHAFASRTLDGALGENREALGEQLRTALQQDLDARASGIELLGVVIESIHPPAGAADAYHRVQAAEIAAAASVANERGRAAATGFYALQEARALTDQSAAAAGERVAAAGGELTGFAADERAEQEGGPAFLLERYFAQLAAALARVRLIILDHRLAAPDAPVIDLRPYAGAAAPHGPLDED
jgi:regulator of protease activity HflC (stomatin/prohibitin superfamily)